MSNKIELRLSSNFAKDSASFFDVLKEKIGLGSKQKIEQSNSDIDGIDQHVADAAVAEIAEETEMTPTFIDDSDKENSDANPQQIIDSQRHGFSLAQSMHMPGKGDIKAFDFGVHDKVSDFTIDKISVGSNNTIDSFSSVSFEYGNINPDTTSVSINNVHIAAAQVNAVIVAVPMPIVHQVPAVIQLPQPIAHQVPDITDNRSYPVVIQLSNPNNGVQLGTVIEQVKLDHLDENQVEADLWHNDLLPPPPIVSNTDIDVSLLPPPFSNEGLPILVIDTSKAPLPLSLVIDTDGDFGSSELPLPLPLSSLNGDLLASAKLEVSADANVSQLASPPPPPPPRMDMSIAIPVNKPATLAGKAPKDVKVIEQSDAIDTNAGNSFLEQIRAGTTLKKLDVIGNNSNSENPLLEQIRAGKTLKKVEVIEKNDVIKPLDGQTALFAQAFENMGLNNKNAASSTSSDTDSGSGWDDEVDWSIAPEGLGSAPEDLGSSSPEGLGLLELKNSAPEGLGLPEIKTTGVNTAVQEDLGSVVPKTIVLDKPPENLRFFADEMDARRKAIEGDNDSSDWDGSSDEADVSSPKSDFFTSGLKALANLNLLGGARGNKTQSETQDTVENTDAPGSELLDTPPEMLGIHVDDGLAMQTAPESLGLVEQHVAVDSFM